MSDKIFLKDITLPIIETGENETYSFVQTDSDLETAGDAADAKKVGDELTALKADLSDIIETETIETDVVRKSAGETEWPNAVSVATGYLRNMTLSNPGNLAGTGSEKNKTFSFLAQEDMDVYMVCNVGSSRYIGVFSGAAYGTSNRVTPVYSSEDQTYPMPTKDNPLHVSAGQYLTFSYYNSQQSISNITWAIIKVTAGDCSLKNTLPLTDTMHTQVVDEIHTAMMSGYYHLPVANFARRAWSSSGTDIDNRLYRVRYTEPIIFDSPCTIIMEKGFTVAGYGDGVFFNSTTVAKLRPNVEYKLYVRRYTEDTSEVADVNTFANALKISTSLAPVELYSPTFADVSMFERVGICGDSYAAGGGIISGITSLTWGKNLERQAGITVDIYAKSGQTVVQWVQDTTRGLPSLLAGTECGLYWLQHGINGTSTPEELGTEADITASPHPATFYGQYTEAIEQIKTTFPKARIIMASIIGSSYGLYQSTYADVNTAIQKIAEYCEVMYVDVTEDDFYRSIYYPQWIRSNHPTAMQCAGIAMANRRLISKCIHDNGDYFVTYGT